MSSDDGGELAAPPARSGGLDDRDGGPERGVYIQMRRIEQVRVGRGYQRGDRAVAVTLVAPKDIGKDRGLVGCLGLGGEFRRPAAGAHLRQGVDENLNVGIRTNDRADVAAVEHRAGWRRREGALQLHEGGPHLRNGGDDRGHFGEAACLQLGFVEAGDVEALRRRDCGDAVIRGLSAIAQRLGDGAIQQAGIEMPEPEAIGQPLAERALA